MTAKPAEDAPVPRTTSSDSTDVRSEGDVGLGENGWGGIMTHHQPTTNGQKTWGGGGGQTLPHHKKKDVALEVPVGRKSGNGSTVKVLRSENVADVEI